MGTMLTWWTFVARTPLEIAEARKDRRMGDVGPSKPGIVSTISRKSCSLIRNVEFATTAF
jgi:hypothetical protein